MNTEIYQELKSILFPVLKNMDYKFPNNFRNASSVKPTICVLTSSKSSFIEKLEDYNIEINNVNKNIVVCNIEINKIIYKFEFSLFYDLQYFLTFTATLDYGIGNKLNTLAKSIGLGFKDIGLFYKESTVKDFDYSRIVLCIHFVTTLRFLGLDPKIFEQGFDNEKQLDEYIEGSYWNYNNCEDIISETSAFFEIDLKAKIVEAKILDNQKTIKKENFSADTIRELTQFGNKDFPKFMKFFKTKTHINELHELDYNLSTLKKITKELKNEYIRNYKTTTSNN